MAIREWWINLNNDRVAIPCDFEPSEYWMDGVHQGVIIKVINATDMPSVDDIRKAIKNIEDTITDMPPGYHWKDETYTLLHWLQSLAAE